MDAYAGQIDPRTSQTYNNFCMYISQHISVLKLCMHVHDPKWEKVTKLQEKQHELNSISDRLIFF